jgi:ABC-type transport system involved in multi-copper enzyme maturation permease subunit
MYLLENPVLQRELQVNLRMTKGFVLLFVYLCLLGGVVVLAWPRETRLDLTENPMQARRLVDLFFLGQFMLTSMMVPAFAAGTITGEKEQKTYEMLLASPLKPSAILLGKLVASLSHLAVLVFSSLPIVMLCLPLGGVSPYEVLAAYLGLLFSVLTFGMISVAASSYFQRTASALVVSYLLILPLALLGVLAWITLSSNGSFRLLMVVTVLPAVCTTLCAILFANTAARLLNPPDVGSEGQEVVDLEQESEEAVGLVIQRDQFPDRLFAPAKRTDLMEDQANPVYDKEIRSEIFSQGTLMLRVVIQVSMLLAIPLMAACLYIWPRFSGWYISYVVLFNMLVGPVFSAGSVTGERERQTLDLLLTTSLTPWQILWGKFVAGLRVSSVLTMFLLWPLALACALVAWYWNNLYAAAAYFGIVLLTCLTTAMLALFCSVVARKTSTSLMMTYGAITILFCAPLASSYFANTFFADSQATEQVRQFGVISPLATVFQVPLFLQDATEDEQLVYRGSWPLVGQYAAVSLVFNMVLMGLMNWLFQTRWRIAR